MTRYLVRPLRADDADRLGEVHVQVWQEAYARLMPAQYLAGLSVDSSRQRWRDLAASSQPGRVVLVGTADGLPVGFCSAGPSRDEPVEIADELYAVNVLAAHHGTGLAEQLFTTAIAATAQERPVHLWVLRGNERACGFYRRHGFAPDGHTKLHEPSGRTEQRWVRR